MIHLQRLRIPWEGCFSFKLTIETTFAASQTTPRQESFTPIGLHWQTMKHTRNFFRFVISQRRARSPFASKSITSIIFYQTWTPRSQTPAGSTNPIWLLWHNSHYLVCETKPPEKSCQSLRILISRRARIFPDKKLDSWNWILRDQKLYLVLA